MSRWLPKEEKKKRDKRVVELYQLGFSYKVIAESVGLSGTGAISNILKKYGVQGGRRVAMSTAGNERRIGHVLQIWVVCPECSCERWVQKGNTKRPGYTGRCMSCYRKVANQEIHTYYV